jgi:ribosome-associated protein
MIQVTDRLWIDERALSECFIRASGPGGQNVNKVASAVQLRFDLAASGLPEEVRARAARLAGKRLTQDGAILITAPRHRTQERNREDALQRLIELIRRAAEPPKPGARRSRPSPRSNAGSTRRRAARASRARGAASRSWNDDQFRSSATIGRGWISMPSSISSRASTGLASP